MVNIEELVSRAREYIEKSDDKFWCMTNEIIALLEAGAIPRGINQRTIEGNYSHEVSYEDIIFITVTEEPAPGLERYPKNK